MSNVGCRIGTWILYGGVPDAQGDVFYISDIEGLGAPNFDIKKTERHGEGSFSNGLRPKDRDILIKGSGYAPSNIDQGHARIQEKVKDAFAQVMRGPKDCYLDYPPSRRRYYVSAEAGGALHFGTPKFNWVEFEIPLWTPDPRLYGISPREQDVQGFGSVQNDGNYETPFTATLITSATNPYIERDGQRITLPGAVPAGTKIDIYNRQTVSSTGAIVDLAAVPRIWFQLAPGANNIVTSGLWKLRWRDGYM